MTQETQLPTPPNEHSTDREQAQPTTRQLLEAPGDPAGAEREQCHSAIARTEGGR